MVYVSNIITVAIAFPFVAIILTVPLLVYHYHRYGSLTILRSVILYSFMFYLVAAYCLIILPLPPRSVVAHLTTPRYNLVPFTFVRGFINSTHFVWTEPSSYLATLKQTTTIQPLFNIFLTVPFGIYLRYFFKTSFKQTLLLSFTLSLFFELTQLSGLYGIYPRPYRLFDVDDLLLNTSGGLLGFYLQPLVTFFLPTRESLDQATYARGQKVGYFRRLLALVVDYCILGVITFIIALIWRLLKLPAIHSEILQYCLATGVYFLIIPTFFGAAKHWARHSYNYKSSPIIIHVGQFSGTSYSYFSSSFPVFNSGASLWMPLLLVANNILTSISLLSVSHSYHHCYSPVTSY